MTLDTFGPTLGTPLAEYDHDSQSWRTYGVISLWGLTECLQTLPKSGMTQNGRLFPQLALAPLIDVKESSVWPTPTAHPDNSNVNGKFQNPTLGDAVRMWPTPTTQEVEHPNATWVKEGQKLRRIGKGIRGHSMGLADAVQTWPTPQANDAKNPYARVREFSQAVMLGEAVVMADPSAIGGRLNPMWVEWLMGFPPGWTDLKD